jgi:hypothetical protein
VSKRSGNSRLPSVTSDIPRDLRMFLDRVRETLASGVLSSDDVREIIRDPGPPGPGGPDDPGGPVDPPTAPIGLFAIGQPGAIQVKWEPAPYRGHNHTEVWASPVDDIRQGEAVGMAPGASYIHAVGSEVGRYYWIRFVNRNGVAGPYNSQAGLYAKSLAYDFPEPPTDDLDDSRINDILNERLAWLEDPTFGLRAEASRIRLDFTNLLDDAIASVMSDLDLIRDEVNDLLVTEVFDETKGYAVDDLVIWLDPSTGSSAIYQCKLAIPVPVPPDTAPLPSNTTYWNQVGDYAAIQAIVDDIAAAELMLQARGLMDANGNVIGSIAAALLSVRSVLEDENGNLLSAGALLSLTSRVTEAEGKITALATAMIEAGVLVEQDGVLVTSTAFLTLIARIESLASNMLGNAEFMQEDKDAEDEWPNLPPENWAVERTGTTATVGTNFSVQSSPRSGDGVRALFFSSGTPLSAGHSVIAKQAGLPVEAEGYYQASVYAGSPLFAVRARVRITFDDPGSTSFASPDVALTKTGLGPSVGVGTTLSDYNRIHVFAQAPAGATTATISIEGTPNTVNPAVLYVTRPFFGAATENQTTPSPWVPGIQSNAYRAAAAAALALDLSYRQPDGPWASATAFLQLKGQIDATEDGLVATNQIALGVKTAIEDPTTGLAATASALDSLRTEVQSGPNSLTSLAARISGVAATIGNNSSNLLEDVAFEDVDATDQADVSWVRNASGGWLAATYGKNAIGNTIQRIPESVAFIKLSGATPADGAAQWSQDVPVTSGQWYQLNAWLQSLRCTARLLIVYRDASSDLTTTSVDLVNTSGDGTTIAGYTRKHVAAVAPSGATTARVIIRATTATGADPTLFALRPFFGEAVEDQAEPSPWLPPIADAFAFQEMRAEVYDDETGLGAIGSLIQGVDNRLNDAEGDLIALSGAFTGLRADVEVAYENRLVRSEDFAIGWSIVGASVLADTVAVPGQLETPGDFIRETDTNGNHFVAQGDIPVEGGYGFTTSVYVRPVGGRHLVIRAVALTVDAVSTGTGYWTFDLATGTFVGTSGNTGLADQIGLIKAESDGWFRCSAMFKVSAVSTQLRLTLFTANTTTNYAAAPSFLGSLSAGLELFGAQVNAGSTPDTYRKTTTTPLYGPIHDRIRATSSAITAVDAQVNDPVTGLPITAAGYNTLNAQVNGAGGLAEMVNGLQAGVGLGGNMLRDPVFQYGETAWSFGKVGSYIYGANLAGWRLGDDDAENTPYIHHPGLVSWAAGDYGDIFQEGIQVEVGKTYQFSVYVGVHRTQSVAIIQWLTTTGTVVGSFSTRPISQVTTVPYSGGLVLSNYGRLFGIGKAPTGAAYARVRIRSRFVGYNAYNSGVLYKVGDVVLSGSTLYTCRLEVTTLPAPPVTNTTYWVNGGSATTVSGSYLFIARPFFGTAKEGQTEPSDWSGGLEPPIFAAMQEKGVVWADAEGEGTAGAIYTMKLRAKDNTGEAQVGFGLGALKENGKWVSDVRFSSNRFAIMDPVTVVDQNKTAKPWQSAVNYYVGDVVSYFVQGDPYVSGVFKCNTAHLSGMTPAAAYWTRVGYYPFIVEGGKVYIDTAIIKTASIGTLLLGDNVVTVPTYIYNQFDVVGNGNWQSIGGCAATITNNTPWTMPVLVQFSARQGYSNFGVGIPSPGTAFQIQRDGFSISIPSDTASPCVAYQDYLIWVCASTVAPNSSSTFVPWWYGANNTVKLTKKSMLVLGVKR